MTAPRIVDPAASLGQALADASPDLMRHLLGTVINSLLSAEADAVHPSQPPCPYRGRIGNTRARGTTQMERRPRVRRASDRRGGHRDVWQTPPGLLRWA